MRQSHLLLKLPIRRFNWGIPSYMSVFIIGHMLVGRHYRVVVCRIWHVFSVDSVSDWRAGIHLCLSFFRPLSEV